MERDDRDREILTRWRPEPPTPRELRALEEVDYGDFEIYRNKLELACWEAYQTFQRMGVSPMIEAGDAAVGIYTRLGDLAVGIMGTQLHLINASIGLKWTMRHFYDEESVGIREGDMFYVNDALYGGIHNSDQILYMPFFVDGELIAWVAAASHEVETGAMEPGGNPPSAESRYDEGLILSPIRIGENYTLREDLMWMMENRIRDPRMQTLDVKARVAACSILERRLHEVVDKKGTEFVIGSMRRMIDEGNEAARKKLASMNDGIYRSTGFMDNAGSERYGLIQCMVEVEKRGDEAHLRFYGSPRVKDGNFNMYPHMMVAMFACYMYQFLFWELPATTGYYTPFSFEFQKDSFFDADEEDATSLGVATTAQVITLVHEAFEKLKFASPYHDYVMAPWPGTSSTTAFAGLSTEGVEFGAWDQGQPNGIGQGARWDHDGLDTAGFAWCAIGEYLDVEQIEENYPVAAIFRSRFWRDGPGMGKYRGGRSMTGLYQVRGTPMLYSVVMGGFSGRPMAPGLFGGYPSRPLAGALIRDNNLDELIEEGRVPTDIYEAVERLEGDWQFTHSNWGEEKIYHHDCWIGTAPSGPGYGDVLERDPELVMTDLREDALSHHFAREIYKVVYDEETLLVDAEATELMRKEERENRIARATPYEDWQPGWSKKRPPQRVLEEYGFWPHGSPGRMMLSVEPVSEEFLPVEVRDGLRPPAAGIIRSREL